MLNENTETLHEVNNMTELDKVLRKPDFLGSFVGPSPHPPKKICVVSLFGAPYTDPETGLRFSSASAYEILKENAPLWTKRSGVSVFYEAKRIIEQDRDELGKKLRQASTK